MYCNKCGSEISPNARFCPKCGASTNNDISYQEIYKNPDLDTVQEQYGLRRHSIKFFIHAGISAVLAAISIAFGLYADQFAAGGMAITTLREYGNYQTADALEFCQSLPDFFLCAGVMLGIITIVLMIMGIIFRYIRYHN